MDAALTPSGGVLGLPPGRGGSVGEVSRLAWPVVLQMSAETLLQVVTSAFVGRIGATELGAVGFGGVWVWTLLVPFFGAASGVQVFVSQTYGAGRRRECGPWLWHALYTLVPAAALWTLVAAAFFPALIAWIGPSPELEKQTLLYANARFLGVPLVVTGSALMSFFRGLGDTRTPMLAMCSGVGVHLVCAYGLIFGELGLPEWGVYGAGLSIVISELVFVLFLGAAILRRRVHTTFGLRPVAPALAPAGRFLRTSAPIGGQWLLDMVSFAIFTSVVARMGDAEMAASQAMIQLLSLSFMQATAIGVAAGTLVGRYAGARELDSAQRSFESGTKLVGLLAAAVAFLFVAFPEALMRLFTNDESVLALARPLLLLGALFQALDALGIVASGSLRGGGDTRWPFLVHATYAWALRLPALWLATIYLDGGLLGAWVAELVTITALAATLYARFQRGRWRTIEI